MELTVGIVGGIDSWNYRWNRQLELTLKWTAGMGSRNWNWNRMGGIGNGDPIGSG